MASAWAKDQILACDTEELIHFLEQHGFDDCIKTFRKRDIDGELFLKLDQSKLKFWKHDLPSRRVEDLIVFVEKVKLNPEKYVERQTETRKSNVSSKPLKIPRNVEVKKSINKQSDTSNPLVKKLKPRPPISKKTSSEDLPISSQLKLALEKRKQDQRARNNQWNQPGADKFEQRQSRKKYAFETEEVEYANQDAETDELQYLNHELETEKVEYANHAVEDEIKSRENLHGRKKIHTSKNKKKSDRYETEMQEIYANQDVESEIGRIRQNMKHLEFINQKVQSELERIQKGQKDNDIIEYESFDDEKSEDDDEDAEPEHIYDKVEENEANEHFKLRNSHKTKPFLKHVRDSEVGWPSFDEDDDDENDNDKVSSQFKSKTSRNNNNEQPNSTNPLQNEIQAKLNQLKLKKLKNNQDETLPIQEPKRSPMRKHSNQPMEEPSSTWKFQKFAQLSANNQSNPNENVSSKQYKTNTSIEGTKKNRKNSEETLLKNSYSNSISKHSRQRVERDIAEDSDKYEQNRHLAVPMHNKNPNKISKNRDSQSSTSSLESIKIDENPIPLPPRIKASMNPKQNKQSVKNSNFMSSTSSIDSMTSRTSKGSTSKERTLPVTKSFNDDDSADSDSYVKPAVTPDIIRSLRRPVHIEPARNEPNLPNLTLKRPLPKAPIHQYEYFHDITRNESEKTLKGRKDGTFIFRPSRQKGNVCVLCVVYQNKVYHIPVRPKANGDLALGLQKENEQNFSNLYEIVSYFHHEQLALIREGEKIGTVILFQGILRV